MRIEIYRLRRTGDGRRGLDPNELVARVEIIDKRFRISCADAELSAKISQEFNTGVRLQSGDEIKELPALSDGAVFDVLRWVLPD
jgi:hypothetical protein